MQVWRIHIRPGGGDQSVVHADCVDVCLRHGIVGVGWGLTHTPADPYDAEEVRRQAWDPKVGYRADSAKSFGSALNALSAMAVGDLVWLRDTKGTYYLARVTGPYRYTTDPACSAVDLFNVVPVDIRKVGLPSAVPGSVINAFRPARTVQRINKPEPHRYSEYLWCQLTGQALPDMTDQDVFAYLTPEEAEDVLFVMLQHEGYVVLPNGRKGDTMSYEYVLRHREDGHEAVAQVKTGDAPVDLDQLPDSVLAIGFQTNDRIGQPARANQRVVTRADALDFMTARPELLPEAVQGWLRLTGHIGA